LSGVIWVGRHRQGAPVGPWPLLYRDARLSSPGAWPRRRAPASS